MALRCRVGIEMSFLSANARAPASHVRVWQIGMRPRLLALSTEKQHDSIKQPTLISIQKQDMSLSRLWRLMPSYITLSILLAHIRNAVHGVVGEPKLKLD